MVAIFLGQQGNRVPADSVLDFAPRRPRQFRVVARHRRGNDAECHPRNHWPHRSRPGIGCYTSGSALGRHQFVFVPANFHVFDELAPNLFERPRAQLPRSLTGYAESPTNLGE